MGQRYLSKTGSDGTPSAESIGVNFAKSNGITDTGAAGLAQLRALPADKVVNGLNMASMWQAATTYPGPMIDGAIVTESPQSAIVAGRWAKVPIIIGANSMDIGFPQRPRPWTNSSPPSAPMRRRPKPSTIPTTPTMS